MSPQYYNDLERVLEFYRLLAWIGYAAVVTTPILLAIIAGHLGSLRNELRGWKG